ncbi:MAG TPA: acyltransferase [Stellaceae bacterium]|nr:acyltransferase [Stellaceae bacterium]
MPAGGDGLAPASDARAAGYGTSSTAGSRVVSIQYLRAIAASLVVLHHAFSVPSLVEFYPRPYGSYGVDLFFVISGYIMWSTTADGSRGPRRFWIARIVRIVPLYWIFTSLYIAVALVAPTALFSGALDPVHLLKSYLFIPAAHPATGLILPVYMLGWTLNYEMFFYLVFGLCLLIPSQRWRLLTLVGALGLLVALGLAARPSEAAAQIYTNPLLLEFAAGAVLARLAMRLQTVSKSVGWGLIGGALCWVVVAYTREALPSLIVAHAPPAIATVAGALILEPYARRRPSPLGLFLGDASYSLYLAHPFAQRAWYFAVVRIMGIASAGSEAFLLVTMVVTGLAGGALTYLFVERPILRVGRRVGHLSR